MGGKKESKKIQAFVLPINNTGKIIFQFGEEVIFTQDVVRKLA